MPKELVWGQHLLLDVGTCNTNVRSKEQISLFVKELVNAIDMVAYGEPTIVHFAEHSYEAAGYSLVQLIETSAITGHFSDNNLEAYLDIFSCKPFGQHDAIAVVKKYFAPQTIRAAFVDRGVQQSLRKPFKEVGQKMPNVA
jgi:S-adenosylmethionine/arginine decarboxylase-like enzyme